MKTTTATTLCAALAACLIFTGCPSAPPTAGGGNGNGAGSGSTDVPTFTLAWSEYPSWSVFGVAHEMGLLDAAEGAQGEIEKKWGVDVVLKEASYDSCLNMFTSKNCDAVCMTNMDALIVSPGRDGVAFLPTSTSVGADACIVVDIDNLEELKPHKIYGLQGTVSQYCFVRCVEELEEQSPAGHKPSDFDFTNQDPGAAAVAMAQKQESHRAIMVWNPFVLQTLKDRPDAKVLFDSSMIPGEIVDMVVVGADVLNQDGADKFVSAVIDAFYRMNEELAKPGTGDETLVALGEKFSNLELEDMKKVVQQTKFYKTADDAVALLEGDEFKATMTTVEKFCVDQGLLSDPQYGFGTDGGVKLLFDASHIKAWQQEQ
jgi:NitT/TauT family transport system substrate-binding protein